MPVPEHTGMLLMGFDSVGSRHGSSQAVPSVVAPNSLRVPDCDVIVVAHVIRKTLGAFAPTTGPRFVSIPALFIMLATAGPTIPMKHGVLQLGERAARGVTGC